MKLKHVPLKSFFNERAGVLYTVLLAIAIAVATFIENDFGTAAAQKWIYKATWFELLMALFGISIMGSMFKFKLLSRKLYSVWLFHFSIIIILLGAGVTRIWGYEGMMGIREGSSSNQFISDETYISLEFQDGNGEKYGVSEEVLFSSLGSNPYKQSFVLPEGKMELELNDVVVNAERRWSETDKGVPNLELVFSNNTGRVDDYIRFGESKKIAGVPVTFENNYTPGAINFFYLDSQFFIRTDVDMSAMTMATREQFEYKSTDGRVPLKFRSLYQIGGISMVVPKLNYSDSMYYVSNGIKTKSSTNYALNFTLKKDGTQKSFWVEGSKGVIGKPATIGIGNDRYSVSFGSIYRTLPFSIRLNKFEMERYPGTNSPASFSSKVTLQDPENDKAFDFHIYMNHILDYDGYRFFQSSYDRDEKGTYLSVNHDFWGTWISYLGYFLLTVGMIWTLFAKGSRFSMLRKSTQVAVLGLMVFFQPLKGEVKLQSQASHVSEGHAKQVSEVLVQDVQGRIKPMHTFSREILRKLHGAEFYEGLNADQIVLGIYGNPTAWYNEPIIKIGKNQELKKRDKFPSETHVSYRSFFDDNGKYILSKAVEVANQKQPKERNVYDKFVIKIDERVGIFNMLLSGSLFKWVPILNDANNTWAADGHHHKNHNSLSAEFFEKYKSELHKGIKHSDYQGANQLIQELHQFQSENAADIIPSDTQRSWEILLNKSHIFKRLALINTLLGLMYLILLFVSVFKSKELPDWLTRGLLFVASLSFILHTVGLGVRWYISERAPWSNGYESMIYIAWTAVLAGLIFNRKSIGAMSATYILSGITLFIAHLSFLNPEITPLVPVLKSYWLTIHVSLEAGSYGFLLLGGIIGYINLLLFGLSSSKSWEKARLTIAQLTRLSEITITGGLVMLSIGTYLGGVWANESWGRYWGWDAKETWALVSILVYAFILHMRFIPKFRGDFAFNVASILGFASVLMTYYGVNYYLSGLHSYAAGDPVPVPTWVYYAVSAVLLTIILAKFQERRRVRSSS